MDQTFNIPIDFNEIQKQLSSILTLQPGSNCNRMKPALGVSGAKGRYSSKMKRCRIPKTPYSTKTPRTRIRTTPVITSAVQNVVQDHLFPTTPKNASKLSVRRRLCNLSGNFDLPYDVSTKVDDVINPHDISIISAGTNHSPLREQVSTNESHLQRIQFDLDNRPLHSTMNYPLHSTAMSLNVGVSKIEDETIKDNSSACCSDVTSAHDLEVSFDTNPSMRDWLKQPIKHCHQSPQNAHQYDSLLSNHPRGCFNVIKSAMKKKKNAKTPKHHDKKELSKKMKNFQRAVRRYGGSQVVLLAQL